MKRERLAQRRKDVGLSQERLAEAVGVDRSTVVRWESGSSEPQPWHRPHLAEALGVSVDELAALLLRRPTRAEVGDTEGEDDKQGGDMLRRDVLARSVGLSTVVAAAPLVKILLAQERRSSNGTTPTSVAAFSREVRDAKTAYQASRYNDVFARLAKLLPRLDAACRDTSTEAHSLLRGLAAHAYHVASSVLLKLGDLPMALIAAERCAQHAAASGDPVTSGTSARIMTHVLMSTGQGNRAVEFAQSAARDIERDTNLAGDDAIAVYGALLLRAAIGAARTDDRSTAKSLMAEASAAAHRLGRDGNERWTGFGPTNVDQHQVTIALALGDAGTAIEYARRICVDKIDLTERKACLFVDVAQAYAQWGRRGQSLMALRAAYAVAPEEVRSRPAVHRVVQDLAALARGHLSAQVNDFARLAGVPL